jgi:hypothetical protein
LLLVLCGISVLPHRLKIGPCRSASSRSATRDCTNVNCRPIRPAASSSSWSSSVSWFFSFSLRASKFSLSFAYAALPCHTKSLIAEFQLIFKLTLDEMQVLFTTCLDVKKERNSDGRMTLSNEKLQRTHSIRTTEKAAIHRLSYNRQRRISKA